VLCIVAAGPDAVRRSVYTLQRRLLAGTGTRRANNRKDGAMSTNRTIYEDRVLKLADLVPRNTNRIENVTFINCQIYGPAVLFPEGGEVNNCSFDAAGMDNVIWKIPPDEPKVGGINMVNCIFEGCRFSMIGVAATPEQAEKMVSEAA
jgi:hypothetical protein